MKYNECGESGLKLPAVSLGLWHNFGAKDNYENMRQMCFTAFDNGITHFGIANNCGRPVNGSAGSRRITPDQASEKIRCLSIDKFGKKLYNDCGVFANANKTHSSKVRNGE